MKKFFIDTMGCQMNDYESDCICQILLNHGYSRTNVFEESDLIIINTCTVREKAQQKAFSQLGRMFKHKKTHPDVIIGIAGCVAQQNGAPLLKRFPALDFVLGTRETSKIADILDLVIQEKKRVVFTDIEHVPGQGVISAENYFKGRINANVSIMEGCDNFCSYCIVPYVRGREISRSPQDIINEVEGLISQGVREITLLGQNVNSYCSKEGRGTDFPALLRMVGKIEGLKRLRFTTSHPKDVSEGLFRAFEEIDVLCHHIHLPFQSGSDRILRLMNRNYTRESYMALAMRFRKIRPDFAITSDVMVGFPGETDDDFTETLELIKEIEFDNVFSFKYSDRDGTRASRMENKIDEAVKIERLKILQDTQKQITLKRNRGLEGKIEEVLVDGSSRSGNQMKGRTRTNKIVNFDCDNSGIGDTFNVLIKRGLINSLKGEVTG